MFQIKQVCFLAVAAIVFGVPAIGADTPNTPSKPGSQASFQAQTQGFLAKYCFSCHGPEKQKSRIRFDQLQQYRAEDSQLWTKVHEVLSVGEMPPEDQAQPSAAERKQLLSWIEREQRAANVGSTRRLNRRELSAALQDVTGLAVDYALSLPEDGKTAGFDTGAAGLQDAADSVTQIMRITRRAVDGIRFLDSAPGKTLVADIRNAPVDKKGRIDARKILDHWKKDGAYVKTRGFAEPKKGLYLLPKWLGERGDALEFSLPVHDGRRAVLRLKVVVSASKAFENLPNPHLWVEVGEQIVDYGEVTGTLGQPETRIYEIQIDDLAIASRGLGVTLTNRVEMPYSVKGFANEDKSKPDEKIPGGQSLFRPAYDRKKTLPHEAPVPFVVLHAIEVVPNSVVQWPPAHWQADVGEIKDDDASAKRLLNLWMERAWRRPVDEKELERFIALYLKLRQQGSSFGVALRAVFQSVLLTANFRYLSSPGISDGSLAQYALASRLSFMLIGAPPDKELLQCAAEKKLRDPKVLDAQVDRLLSDPRSEAFWRPFVSQWLELGQPITLVMDHIQKQDFRFGRYLKASMREESIQYIMQLVAENKPAGELLTSDWTMMNNSLAYHYGYKGIEGGHLRKVKLRADDPRGGGLLSHAGIQSMLCWMGDNWVIYRGAWAMRHILDDPPPPPPLEVPELDPSANDNKGKSMKQLLLQHQANPNCAVCHKDMDPLGFAFQNFDISGRWRDVEHEKYARNELDGKIEWRGIGKTRPVDTVGQLPRGEKFTTFAECKAILAKNYNGDLVRGLMKNWVIFGTGRKPDVRDMAEIQSIMKEQAAKKYPMRDMLKAVIRSTIFVDR